MENFICVTCGTQFARSIQPAAVCPICEDERQYVGREGQKWTTLKRLYADRRCGEEGAGVLGIGIEPEFAIRQRALLVQ